MDGTLVAKKYDLMHRGEEGSKVIANPEGEAISDLLKLQIEEIEYQIWYI